MTAGECLATHPVDAVANRHDTFSATGLDFSTTYAPAPTASERAKQQLHRYEAIDRKREMEKKQADRALEATARTGAEVSKEFAVSTTGSPVYDPNDNRQGPKDANGYRKQQYLGPVFSVEAGKPVTVQPGVIDYYGPER